MALYNFGIPVLISTLVCILYFSVDAFPSFRMHKPTVLKAGIMCLVIYYATVRIQYGLFALIFFIIAVQLFHFKDELTFLKTQEIFQNKMKSFIDAINQNESTAIETIPRIIIQIWVQHKGNAIPKLYVNYMTRMRELHPEYQYLFFNEDDIDVFFKSNYPEYYGTYQRLPVFIQKLDFFRYLAIYHYGGFYFDADIEPLNPLDDTICNHQLVFPVDEYIPMCENSRFSPICKKGMKILLGQYAFAAVPKHPFIKLLIDTIHRNIDVYIQQHKVAKNIEVYVYRTTGPDFVTYVYAEYAAKNQIYILANGKRQMFGDYARHDFAGSWK